MNDTEVMAKPRSDRPASEVLEFRMHHKLLVDVITRQAGSLDKAVAEAVMNSIDAGATKIDVAIDETHVKISDDGKGFRSRQEIQEWFGTFGMPHTEEEKKIFGVFRMGRGQGFAFGRNTWRTGAFEMKVDIRDDAKGLSYDLLTDLPMYRGCEVAIELYEPIYGYSIRNVEDEIRKMVKFVAIPVTINGKAVNVDPASRKWDFETDDAWVEVTDAKVMRIYNLGVYIKDHGTHEFGSGGTVVSKVPFKMNFARNDIIADCEVWKRVRKFVHSQVDDGAKTKKLTDAMRLRLVRRFRDDDLTVKEKAEAPIFKDAVGRWWSIAKMKASARRFSGKISMGDRAEDRRADKLMQLGAALVLDEKWVKHQFECSAIKKLLEEHILPVFEAGKESWETWPYSPYVFKEVAKDLNNAYDLLDKKQWTPIETSILTACRAAAFNMLHAGWTDSYARPKERRLTVGVSGVAEGWTDGETYIAIDRDWLSKAGTDADGWIRIGQLLTHEYCHDNASGSGHVHDNDFYETYHNALSLALHHFVPRAMLAFSNSLEAAGKRLTKKQLAANGKREKVRTRREKVEALMAPQQSDPERSPDDEISF